MKTEKLIIFVLFLGLMQLAACERGKTIDPAPNSLRTSSDSLGNYPGDSLGNYPGDSLGNYPSDSIGNYPVDSIPGDSIFVPDTLGGGVDSLPFVDSVSLQGRMKANFRKK